MDRPYPGHVQHTADPKWPIIFSMWVAQQQEVQRLQNEGKEDEPALE